LKDFKGKDDNQVAWAKALTAVFQALHDYVKKVHTTGVAWNPKGGEAKAAAGAAAPAASAPPAAPTGKPPAPKLGGGGDDAKAGLFAALNKGALTSGLKKVDKSQMTHKNPELRASSVVKDIPKPKPASKPAFGAAAAKKDPVFELQGKKWVVEYQNGNNNILIEDTELRQTVYLYKCENSTVQVKGKVNSITLDSCKKVGVAFENAVSMCEIINCKSIQVQVLGKVPTVSIDKCDGAQVYLSKDSMDTEIVTAKSSEMNVLVPQEDGDFKEMPVAEQFKTVYDPASGKLVTSCTDIAG
jgi:adenylyl cyclase-associated protein